MTRNPLTAYAESRLQCALVAYLRRALPATYRVFSCPNGGHLASKANAQRLKREGLTPGVPDLIIIRQDGYAAFLELKAGRNGLTDDQIDWTGWLTEGQAPVAVIRSLEEAEAALRAWNVPLRGRLAA